MACQKPIVVSTQEGNFLKVQASTVIDRAVEDVWEFVSDFGSAPEWKFAEGVKQTSAGPLGVGTTFQHWTHLMGKRLVYEDRITAWEPNKKLMVMSEKNFRNRPAYVEITLEPVGGKTRLTMITALERPTGLSPWRLLMPILVWTFKRGKLEGNIRRILESQTLS